MAFVNFLLAFSAPGKAKPCYIVQADDPLDQRIKPAFEKRISSSNASRVMLDLLGRASCIYMIVTAKVEEMTKSLEIV
jgi:hypothetical protein